MKKIAVVFGLFCLFFIGCGGSDPPVCEIVCSHRWTEGTKEYNNCMDATCDLKDPEDE